MARTKNVNVKRRSNTGPCTAKTGKFYLSKGPFARFVRGIIFAHLDEHPEYELTKYNVRLQKEAIEYLQIVSEAFLNDFCECLQLLLTVACKRTAIMQQQINLYVAGECNELE